MQHRVCRSARPRRVARDRGTPLSGAHRGRLGAPRARAACPRGSQWSKYSEAVCACGAAEAYPRGRAHSTREATSPRSRRRRASARSWFLLSLFRCGRRLILCPPAERDSHRRFASSWSRLRLFAGAMGDSACSRLGEGASERDEARKRHRITHSTCWARRHRLLRWHPSRIKRAEKK